MKMKQICGKIILGVFFLTLSVQSATAANVLFFVDYMVGVDYVTPALAAGGHTVTTAIDWSDFNAKLASGSWDLAIALNQDYTLYADLTTLSNYIAGGGRVIFTDWKRTPSFAALFNAAYTAAYNMTPTTLTDPALLVGIANPVALSNPGWGLWSMGMTPLAGGTSLGTFPNGDSSIVTSNANRTVILGFLSDTLPEADGQQFWENLINFVLGNYTPVPAVSTSGLILFALILVISTIFAMRRRVHG